MEHSSHRCEVCADDNCSDGKRVVAACFCSQCYLLLCQRCSSTHHKYPALSRHHLHDLRYMANFQKPLWSDQRLQCSFPEHGGKPVELFCLKHQELLCPVCASTGHRKCHSAVVTLRQAAWTFCADLADRVRKLRVKEAAIASQMDHITNDFRVTELKLHGTFRDLQKALDDRKLELTRQILAQEDLVKSSLTKDKDNRGIIRLTTSSVEKMADTAPDDALLAMAKSLTSRLDDVEKKPDVTSTVQTGSLSFDESKVSQLKNVIAHLGQFRPEGQPPTPKGPELARRLRNGQRVKRSSQWISDNKDGGTPGAVGTVFHVGKAGCVLQGMVNVCWDSGPKHWHQMGRDHVYELELA